ncbi:hypothetical protein SEVIR_2G216183v4 [Setaria viridis]
MPAPAPAPLGPTSDRARLGRTARARHHSSRPPCDLDRSVRDVGGRDLAAGETKPAELAPVYYSVSGGARSAPVPCASRFTNHDRPYEKDPARILHGSPEVNTRALPRPVACRAPACLHQRSQFARDVRLLAGAGKALPVALLYLCNERRELGAVADN